jgi:WD40 repeat protein
MNKDYFVSCAHDGTIKLWSLTSNYTQVKSWQAASSYVLALAFDSTLNVLANGDVNSANNVKVWDSSLWAYSGKRFRNKESERFSRKFDFIRKWMRAGACTHLYGYVQVA